MSDLYLMEELCIEQRHLFSDVPRVEVEQTVLPMVGEESKHTG